MRVRVYVPDELGYSKKRGAMPIHEAPIAQAQAQQQPYYYNPAQPAAPPMGAQSAAAWPPAPAPASAQELAGQWGRQAAMGQQPPLGQQAVLMQQGAVPPQQGQAAAPAGAAMAAHEGSTTVIVKNVSFYRPFSAHYSSLAPFSIT